MGLSADLTLFFEFSLFHNLQNLLQYLYFHLHWTAEEEWKFFNDIETPYTCFSA